MTSNAENVLKYLRDSGKTSFVFSDLTNASDFLLSEITARKVLQELEDNGYIESHPEYITNPFYLV